MPSHPETVLRTVQANGLQMHIAEQGDPAAPLVLLMHGWPETWYSWRFQMPALAAAGYHVVAPDMRGYGSTDAPTEIASYDCANIARDMLALLDVLNKPCYALVGHDWGAILVWPLGLLHPTRFPRLCAMSVPPTLMVSPVEPIERVSGPRFGDKFNYILFANEFDGRYGKAWPVGREDSDHVRGVAESSYDSDPDAFLRALYLSGASLTTSVKAITFDAPKVADVRRDAAANWLDRMATPRGGAAAGLPAWLTEGDLQQYVSSYRSSGFRGGLSYYRCIDRNWHITKEPLDTAGRKLHQPTFFIAGKQDAVIAISGGEVGVRKAVENLCSDSRGFVFIDDCGHWNTQEKPEETNVALIGFLNSTRDLGGSRL